MDKGAAPASDPALKMRELERRMRAEAAESRKQRQQQESLSPKMVSPTEVEPAPKAVQLPPQPPKKVTIPSPLFQPQQAPRATTQAPWDIIRSRNRTDWHDVNVDFKSQFKDEGLEVACTAFGIASSWYFLRRAQPSQANDRRHRQWQKQGKDYYELRFDTVEIHDIRWMTLDVYRALLDPESPDNFISSPESVSLQKYPRIAEKSLHGLAWRNTYGDCPLGAMPLTFMLCSTQFRVARSRRYRIKIAGEMLVVHVQDHIGEPELSEQEKKQKAREYVSARAIDDIDVFDDTERDLDKRTLLNTYLANLNALTDRHASLLKYGKELPEALPAGDVEALYNDLVKESKLISTTLYKPLLEAWNRMNPLRKEQAPARVLSQTDRDRKRLKNAIIREARLLLEGKKPMPEVVTEVHTDPFQDTLMEDARRISLPNMPSIVEVAAQIYYSPYMYNPLMGTNYPFSLVVSEGDLSTFSIFRDSEPSTPWLLFDTHGGGGGGVDDLSIVREYLTIESLGTYPRMTPDKQATFQLLMRQEDRDAVVKTIINSCHDTFLGLEPFRPVAEYDDEWFTRLGNEARRAQKDAAKSLLDDSELDL